MKKYFTIKGMTCHSCKERIENALKESVDKIDIDFSKEIAIIEFDESKIAKKELLKKIEEAGYEASEISTVATSPTKQKQYIGYAPWVITVLGSIVLIYFLYTLVEGMNIALPEIGGKASLLLLFLVGILTGFHCVSMCGGFLLSYTAKNVEHGHNSFFQHLVYGTSKTISYTVIGVIFGLIGSIFFFSPSLRGGIAIFAGIFMVFYSLSMFGFKSFRKFQFNPKFLAKIASKKYSGPYFGPMMTGLLNGLFIACGPLQAMYLYAAGTGDPIKGGISLMAFGLGTLPVMLGFGGIANVVSHKMTRKILKVSAIIVLILGLIMLNRGLSLTGSGYDLKSLMAKSGASSVSGNIVLDSDGYQIINMEVSASGWTPDKFALQKDIPVKWVIDVKELTGCNNAIQSPKLDLNFKLKKGVQTIEFTPTEAGVISWSCWMGMIPGTFIVTENGVATDNQIQEASSATSSGGSCGGGSTCGEAGSCGGGCGGGCGG